MLSNGNQAFTSTSFLAFHLFHANQRLEVFILWATGLGMVSYIRLDGRKDIVSVKPTRTILYSELKACMLPLLEKNKGCKTNEHNDLVIRI